MFDKQINKYNLPPGQTLTVCIHIFAFSEIVFFQRFVFFGNSGFYIWAQSLRILSASIALSNLSVCLVHRSVRAGSNPFCENVSTQLRRGTAGCDTA